MGGEYPNGGGRYSWGIRPSGGGGRYSQDIRPPGAVFLGISPPFERGRISWGGGGTKIL